MRTRGAGRQTDERHTADAAIIPTVFTTCACPDIHNPTEPQTIRVGPTSSASIRVSRHTQHNRSTNPNRLGPQQAHLSYAQTYITRQTRLPNRPPRHQSARRACHDIHNPTNRPITDLLCPTIPASRMSRHTQPDKPSSPAIYHAITPHTTHAPTNTTRQTGLCEDPLTQRGSSGPE